MDLGGRRSVWAVVGRRHAESGMGDATRSRARRVVVAVLVCLSVVGLAAGVVPLAVAGGSGTRPVAITGRIYLKDRAVRSGGTVHGEVVFQNASTRSKVLMRGCRVDGLFGIGLRASDGYVQAPAFSLVGCSPEQALVAKPGVTVYRFALRATYTACSQSAAGQPPRRSRYWTPSCLKGRSGHHDVMPPLPAGRYTALFFPAGVWHGPHVKPARLVVTATGAAASVPSRKRAVASSVPVSAIERAARSGSGRWSAPAALVSAGTAATSLGISATPGGSLLAGWIEGPPPRVMAGGPTSAGAASASPTSQAVMVAAGRFGAAFQPPIKLSKCQWPSRTPHPRPRFLPTGGHLFSPLVATKVPTARGC
jgi:hypothetical protein